MWLVYFCEDAPEVGFTVGEGAKEDCVKYCEEHEGYVYCYYDCY